MGSLVKILQNTGGTDEAKHKNIMITMRIATTIIYQKEQQLLTILELVEVERQVPKTSLTQWLGRKILEREAIAGALVAKAF
jgi:hypothetical protein